MTNYSALHYSEKARKAAVGTIDEYPAGSAEYWAKQAEAIVNIKDASETEKGIARLATTSEATAGTNDTTIMTPKKVKQVVDALQVQDATESVKGIAMLATQADALAGADDSKIMTPAKVAVVTQELHDDIDDVAQYAKDLKERVDEIELFKFPNATIIGNPTINNGQISGFTANDYLQFPFELDLTNRRLRVEFVFTTSSNVTTQQNVMDSQFGIALAIANGKGLMAVSSNGTSWNIGSSVGTMTIQTNTTYYARMTWDGLQYKTFLSTNGVDYVQDMTLVSNQRPYPRTIFIGGCSGSAIGHDPHPFLGTINLNKAFLYLNDVLIWQGMDDAGLATRADVSLDNLDAVGQAKFDAKQDVISDLETIRTGAGLGATALQSITSSNVTTALGFTPAKSTDLTTHTGNGTIHVTASDKIAWSQKQERLVSGTNIKTLNGSSILGSGDLEIGGYLPDILEHKWSDYILNDMAWLRADTFSWQSGQVYSTAYQHLVADLPSTPSETYYAWKAYNNVKLYTKTTSPTASTQLYEKSGSDFVVSTGTIDYTDSSAIYVTYRGELEVPFSRDASSDEGSAQTETIAGITIEYITATDGHKIVLPTQETAVEQIYQATGVAWYYIVDTTNQRFKLPRIDSTREGLLQKAIVKSSNYAPTFRFNSKPSYSSSGWTINSSGSSLIASGNGQAGYELVGGVEADFSEAESIYKGHKYLYFYVGEYSRSAVEQTAGLNAELFNGKVDKDSSWGFPSNRYIDLTLGASGTEYTAPANGWFCVAKTSGGTNQYLGLVSNGLHITVYYNSGMTARNFIPTKKGGIITVNYNMTGTTEFFRFIYAEGEQ